MRSTNGCVCVGDIALYADTPFLRLVEVVQLRGKKILVKLLKRRVCMAGGSTLMENSKAIATCRGSKHEVVLKQHYDNGDWVVTYVDGGVRASFGESALLAYRDDEVYWNIDDTFWSKL